MTVAVWVALVSALAVLVGQWGTGRLFARLKDIEERQDQIDAHLTATDAKVELLNKEGSHRHDEIQKQYWEMKERIKVLETLEGIHKKDTDKWSRS